jgi:hypothetical protein
MSHAEKKSHKKATDWSGIKTKEFTQENPTFLAPLNPCQI